MFSGKFWSDPSEEAPRTQRVLSAIKQHLNLSNLLFFVSKSNNDNSIIYMFEHGHVVTNWFNVEDKSGSRNELNPAETVVLGCSVRQAEDRILIQMNQEQLSNRLFEIVMDGKGNPAVIGVVNGVNCRVERAYAQMKNSPVPEAEYLNLYGRSLVDGKLVVEKIKA
jgi:hypothetical protein